MQKSDFNFELPEALIARYPLASRSESRLLVGDPETQSLVDSQFHQLANFLNPGDLLVFNDSKVIPARIYATKPSGGKVEILLERLQSFSQALAHLGSNKPIKIGQVLLLPDGSEASVLDKQGRLFLLQFAHDAPLLERLNQIGHMPLPPYLKRKDEVEDVTRYQTVYARHEGSVAAPTAGLHFDEAMFAALKQKKIDIAYVTLHVGAGTFMPVQVDNIHQHVMHAEWMELGEEACQKILMAKARGNRVIAVGTTSLRCLETAAATGEFKPCSLDTNIFILPGYDFKIVDALITNFHLPESTLLMLVSAFVGFEFMQRIYRHAINERYRFYSYGDTSLLYRCPHSKTL